MNTHLDWFRSHDPFCPTASLSDQRVGLKWVASIVMKQRKSAVRYNEVVTVYSCQKCNHKEASDGAHTE